MALIWKKVLDENANASDIGAVDVDLSNAPAAIKNDQVSLSKDASGNISLSGAATGSISLAASDVGLGNVTNESKDSILAGNFTGTIAGAAAASIKSGSGLGASANQDSTATILAGDLTGTIGGVSASTVKSNAESAKNAVEGNAPVIMGGGSINIGAGSFTVDSSGNVTSDGGMDLTNDGIGTIDLNMWGANPTINVGGANGIGSPTGTAMVNIRRGNIYNSARLQFYTGLINKFSIGFADDPTDTEVPDAPEMFRMHPASIYDNTEPYGPWAILFHKSDNKVGFNKTSAPAYTVDIGGDLNYTGNLYKNGSNLDGIYAASSHNHSGSDITSGTVVAARIHDDAKAWHGHSRIIIKPADFIPNDDNSYYNVAMVDDGGKIKVTSSTLEAYAQYEVPNGYKATHVKLYGSDSENTVMVFEHSISTTTATLRTGVPAFVGTQHTLTTAIVGSSTTYLSVKWLPSATDDYLYGGYITLAKV